MNKEKLNIPPELGKILEYWRLIVPLLFLVIILWSSIFQISTEGVGVITRFGKYVRQVEPGLNFKIPLAEDFCKVPVERQQKLEFGFRTARAGINTQHRESSSTKDESLMLTGDFNLAEVQWVVQYRVMETFEKTFDRKTSIFISTDSELYKYLKTMN
jgi:membrane protease subunit HflK